MVWLSWEAAWDHHGCARVSMDQDLEETLKVARCKRQHDELQVTRTGGYCTLPTEGRLIGAYLHVSVNSVPKH